MPLNVTTGTMNLGDATDVGVTAYNGVTFSAIITSTASCVPAQDASGRTVKYVECTFTVNGYATLDEDRGDTTTDRILEILRQKLTANAGTLTYTAKGFGSPFIVNQPGGVLRDVAWGPKPKLFEFVPLGGSRGASIKWQVTTCIPEVQSPFRVGTNTVLQFNQENSISYDEDGYSRLHVAGILEIPLTRVPQGDKVLTKTVDDFRQRYMTQVANTFDLTRFRVTDRDFKISMDARTLDWRFTLEELPPMPLPAGFPTARGRFRVRNRDVGMSMIRWVCTLSATYPLLNGMRRRESYMAFMRLCQFRMNQSVLGIGTPQGPAPNNGQLIVAQHAWQVNALWRALTFQPPAQPFNPALLNQPNAVQANQRAIPQSFSIDEGIYLDSKSVTFESSWLLITNFATLMVATGIWQPVGGAWSGLFPSQNARALWATSVRNISGWKGVLENRVDPASMAIVDFGG